LHSSRSQVQARADRPRRASAVDSCGLRSATRPVDQRSPDAETALSRWNEALVLRAQIRDRRVRFGVLGVERLDRGQRHAFLIDRRWYGRTKRGAYVCRKEADAAGDRDTRNGQ
jgi:hypothetical protein